VSVDDQAGADAVEPGTDNPARKAVGRPGIEVLNRAVDLLNAFTEGPGSTHSLAEIARRTGLPKPTLHRLLAALDVLGLVEKTPAGYQLGIRLFELGEHVPRKQKLREAALPFLQDLFEASHDTVHLAVLDGTDVVYLERIRSPPGEHRLARRPPARLLHRGGQSLLAFNPSGDARWRCHWRARPTRSRTTRCSRRARPASADRHRARSRGELHRHRLCCGADPDRRPGGRRCPDHLLATAQRCRAIRPGGEDRGQRHSAHHCTHTGCARSTTNEETSAHEQFGSAAGAPTWPRSAGASMPTASTPTT
jgi:DNA-binding IclR family transcriptional regulator